MPPAPHERRNHKPGTIAPATPRNRARSRSGLRRAYVIAATSILIAVIMPVLEFIPFSSAATGTALTAFGLSLISRDGLLALLSLSLTGAVIGAALDYLLWVF
ncbi:MAG: exopolysaccharide biosynthesis protein [Wenzhouxiangellaceae bacterium]|nr:exopolysaccharide biosynthesis protein [Wenzhouxiangellaceae bacterium]